MGTTPPSAKKPFVSSILLWMRTDQPRQVGMDYWKGPHSKIISATPGFEEYRQIHLAENNPGLWPAISGVETVIPSERRIDGVAEVTFASALSPLRGRKQTKLAYKDEVNVFRRTLLYAGPPRSARWYDVARPEEKVGARSLIYLRKREDTRTRAFRKFLTGELVPALAGTGGAERAPDPGLHALEPKTLEHAERRARQSHRTAVPRLTHPRLYRCPRSGGVLRQRADRSTLRPVAGGRCRCPRIRSRRGADLREERHRPSALSGIVPEARATVGVPASEGRPGAVVVHGAGRDVAGSALSAPRAARSRKPREPGAGP